MFTQAMFSKGMFRKVCSRRRALRGRELGDARGDAGMTTAEYAVGTVAACGFGAVLYKVVTSGKVSAALQSVIGRALDAQF